MVEFNANGRGDEMEILCQVRLVRRPNGFVTVQKMGKPIIAELGLLAPGNDLEFSIGGVKFKIENPVGNRVIDV
jgi:hypothetical protein